MDQTQKFIKQRSITFNFITNQKLQKNLQKKKDRLKSTYARVWHFRFLFKNKSYDSKKKILSLSSSVTISTKQIITILQENPSRLKLFQKPINPDNKKAIEN